MNISEWSVEHFDRIITSAGDDGSKLSVTKDAFVSDFVQAIMSGDLQLPVRDLEDEARAAFQRYVEPVRQARKNSLRTTMEHLVDALNDDTILGLNDPALDMAFLVGDGRDKILRLWSADDWEQFIMARYRNAADVTTAAAADDRLARQIVDAMRQRQATHTGDLAAGKVGV